MSDEIDFGETTLDVHVPSLLTTTGVKRFVLKFRYPVQMEIGHVTTAEVVDIVREVHERS